MGSGLKVFKTYEEQASLLSERGMDLGNRDSAEQLLERVSYYRLSGYFHPFRIDGSSRFRPGTTLTQVVSLYDFDQRMRTSTFDALAPVEIELRALLGHHLGQIDPGIHERPDLLSVRARQGDDYDRWVKKYRNRVRDSRDDFVQHHRDRYASRLPVWAAVEILDWGSLTQLFNFTPDPVQRIIADRYRLTAPQLHSWIRSLRVVRNVCAHHARMFNKVWDQKPKLPRDDPHHHFDTAIPPERTFMQLTLIQHLRALGGAGASTLLPRAIATYPHIPNMGLERLGAPDQWRDLPLWQT